MNTTNNHKYARYCSKRKYLVFSETYGESDLLNRRDLNYIKKFNKAYNLENRILEQKSIEKYEKMQ